MCRHLAIAPGRILVAVAAGLLSAITHLGWPAADAETPVYHADVAMMRLPPHTETNASVSRAARGSGGGDDAPRGRSPAAAFVGRTQGTSYARYDYSDPVRGDWWVLCSAQCPGTRCGLLIALHGIYSNPGDQTWLMLGSDVEQSFADEGNRPFCMAFLKSEHAPWDYSACNNDVDHVIDVIDHCEQHPQMNVDPMRIALHGFSSGGIFSLWNTNAFTKLGSRVKSFVIYGSNNIPEECNFMQGHLLMVHGDQDNIVRWGSRPEMQTCGTRKILTRVAAIRGYAVAPEESFCAESCDQHYRCFAVRDRVAAQTWAGVTEYYGQCDSSGQFLVSDCSDSAIVPPLCHECYPESPCSSAFAEAVTGATTGSLNLVESSSGATPPEEYETQTFRWGPEGHTVGCEGVLEHWRIRDWNHDYPNRRIGGAYTYFWQKMREWLWDNSGYFPSGCSLEDRYKPSRANSCVEGTTASHCAEQKDVDWCGRFVWQAQGVNISCGAINIAAYGSCEWAQYAPGGQDCCSNTIMPTMASATTSPTTSPASPLQTPSPTPSPTPSAPALCALPDVLNPSALAGHTCLVDGVSNGLDSNWGGASTQCSSDGGSWVEYSCQSASDYYAALPADHEHLTSFQDAWVPKCCGAPSPTPSTTKLCALPDVLSPQAVAGYSCLVDGVSNDLDSNWGATGTQCSSAGGSWTAYSCQTVSDYYAALPADYEHLASFQNAWEPKCCAANPTASPTVTPTATQTASPTGTPTANPTANPTLTPMANPTASPTVTPTANPTATPTASPTANPTATPTGTPTASPTATPTSSPTANPTATPTASPTADPTASPTGTPTASPTATPTSSPTANPTATPTASPTADPTASPTGTPTANPMATPTASPTANPTATPTSTPMANPTATPTDIPTANPTASPTVTPMANPTATPTGIPTQASGAFRSRPFSSLVFPLGFLLLVTGSRTQTTRT
ncbi:unnamed protein product [Prorocentrum cordatum]|uniref:Feruloyl esterase n=1 Tax=Prorocentrum cordatum TaxID=2364126 RepID=A0ABN9RF06_9DINO|nr:unnamed protein product [Polarella glacialis]